MPLNVAVDYQSAFGKKTGIGVAAENLVTAMREQSSDIRWLLYHNSSQELNTPERILWESYEIPKRTLRDRPDLLYSPGFAPPMWGNVPSVVTVHDLIGLALPSNQPAAAKFYWSTWLPKAVRRARRVVASSEWTRKDIEKFLRIPSERIQVVPLGVDESFRKVEDRALIKKTLERHGIARPFFISVGTLEPRKNHLRLLEAYESLKKRGKADFMLVIIGKPAGAEKALRRFVEEKGLREDVLFLGYIRREELVCLYNASLGYIMVSLYEGFGLPVLEAMSCGVSGVCADRTSLPEVAGDTALLVDPEDPEAITQAILRLYEDTGRREALSRAAHERSRLFSTTRTADAMIKVFKDETQK